MRNLTDEQAAEIALDIVRDFLMEGVEFLTIAETVDDVMVDLDEDGEEATQEDYDAVENEVSRIVTGLSNTIKP